MKILRKNYQGLVDKSLMVLYIPIIHLHRGQRKHTHLDPTHIGTEFFFHEVPKYGQLMILASLDFDMVKVPSHKVPIPSFQS